MTIVTYHVTVDPDVIEKYNMYNTDERQVDFYVMVYLNSPDGWSQNGYFFEPADKVKAQVWIRLSLSKTIEKICGLSPMLSCATLGGRDMYLCAERWFGGSKKSGLNLEDYRQYMVSMRWVIFWERNMLSAQARERRRPSCYNRHLGLENVFPTPM
jgi:hypothetical protein